MTHRRFRHGTEEKCQVELLGGHLVAKTWRDVHGKFEAEARVGLLNRANKGR
jgi:hypothetical protein